MSTSEIWVWLLVIFGVILFLKDFSIYVRDFKELSWFSKDKLWLNNKDLNLNVVDNPKHMKILWNL